MIHFLAVVVNAAVLKRAFFDRFAFLQFAAVAKEMRVANRVL
jgi:hypothetical protein